MQNFLNVKSSVKNYLICGTQVSYLLIFHSIGLIYYAWNCSNFLVQLNQPIGSKESYIFLKKKRKKQFGLPN